MSDELSPEMLEEAAPDLLTLEDEDGKEVTFEVIDATEVNGTRYLAVHHRRQGVRVASARDVRHRRF